MCLVHAAAPLAKRPEPTQYALRIAYTSDLNRDPTMKKPAPITCEDDLRELEQTPIAQRNLAPSTYEAFLRGAALDPDKVAMTYFIDGHCYNPASIPLRAKCRDLAARVIRGKKCAEPFRQITFGELREKITRSANLFHSLGVGNQDVVTLLLPNLIETAYVMLGAQAAGIVNPVNPMLEPEIIEGILNAAGTKVLVALGPLPGTDIWGKVQAVRDQVPSLKAIVTVFGRSNPAQGIYSLEEHLDGFDGERLDSGRNIVPEDVASLFHTGGTTGVPKLVVRTHANEVAAVKMLELALPLEPHDTGLIGLPLFHVLASTGAMLGGLCQGTHIVMAGAKGFRTTAVVPRFFEILARHKVSYFCAVPTVFSALLDNPVSPELLASVKFAISAGAPLPSEVFKQFQAKTGIQLLEGYGQTEATVMSSINPIGAAPRIGSIGLRAPYCQMRPVILTPAGEYARDCETDEIGTIVKRGPHISQGYMQTAQNDGLWVVDDDGERWLNSGDLGRRDADGYFWLTGRSRELIIRGGHNIDPRIIEEALHRHPAVAEVAAIGRPDSYAGEVPVAYVVLHNDADPEELMRFAAQHIPERAALPKAVRIISALPTTAIGKVFKPRLIWWETADALRGELRGLQAQISTSSVEVDAHQVHGSIAHVQVNAADGVDRSELEQGVLSLLGRYKIALDLKCQ